MVAVPVAPALSGTDTQEVRRGRQWVCGVVKVDDFAEDTAALRSHRLWKESSSFCKKEI